MTPHQDTHNLVIEQQEIQNTLVPTKFQFPATVENAERTEDDIMDKMVGDLEELLQSKLKKQLKKSVILGAVFWYYVSGVYNHVYIGDVATRR